MWRHWFETHWPSQSNTVLYHFLRSAPPIFLLRPAPPPGAQLSAPRAPCAPAPLPTLGWGAWPGPGASRHGERRPHEARPRQAAPPHTHTQHTQHTSAHRTYHITAKNRTARTTLRRKTAPHAHKHTLVCEGATLKNELRKHKFIY